MSTLVTPSQQNIQRLVKAFLASILQSGVEIVQGEANRVPEPQSSEFVVMTTVDRKRLATNIDNFIDCAFMASIVGSTGVMTVTQMLPVNLGILVPPGNGLITLGNQLLGVNVVQTPNITTVLSQNSGTPGGVGVYTLSQPQAQNLGPAKFATGIGNYIQKTELIIQLDIHSADLKLASDMAQVVSTMWRDAFATTFFDNTALFNNTSHDVSPLYADEPRQIAFINEALQYEARYVLEAHLQANQTVALAQDFFDQAKVTINTPVDATPV